MLKMCVSSKREQSLAGEKCRGQGLERERVLSPLSMLAGSEEAERHLGLRKNPGASLLLSSQVELLELQVLRPQGTS